MVMRWFHALILPAMGCTILFSLWTFAAVAAARQHAQSDYMPPLNPGFLDRIISQNTVHAPSLD